MKNVLITGANKGIGLETARQLAQAGYYVYVGSRDKEKGLKAVNELTEAGLTTVELLEIDVSSIESIKQAVATLESKIKVLDVLINNAGVTGEQPQTISTVDVNEIRKVLETNYLGPIQTTQQCLGLLRNADQPVIINISSEVGSLTMHTSPDRNPNWANFPVYGSSKTILNAFTVMLSNEFKETKFRINSVTPGYTATDFNQHQGTKSVEQGAKVIVDVVLADGTSGKFLAEQGEVPW
ncbi:SDR family NAD(P)-dependent oxidoreductase [Spirosoma arcticum]